MGVAYLIVAWVVLQVVDVTTPILELPIWVPKLVLLILLIGFPVSLLFSWAYELTPDGLKREREVDREKSISQQTGTRLNRLTMVALAAAVAFLLADKFFVDGPAPTQERSKPSIAVLPFVNMSAEASSQYFSDGLADTLLHMLAQINDLHVAARTSSFQFRGQNMDMSKIGEQLQVSSVLEGSVQRVGDQIRVTAQLINADDGYHIWSGTFDRELNDVFAIQDEIANEVVSALQVSLLGREVERLNRRPTENVEAYTEYMLGVADIERFSFESLPNAEQHFRKAVSIDPQYALAHARLAQTYIEMFDTGLLGYEELLEKASPIIKRALNLDPDGVVAVAVQGALLDIVGDTESAERHFRRAIELAPNEILAPTYLARSLQDQDRLTEAVEVLETTLRLDPLSQRALGRASSINLSLQRYDAARNATRRIREIDPLSPSGYYLEAFVDWEVGDHANAIRLMAEAADVDPDDPELPIQIGDWYLDMLELEGAEYWYRRGIAVDPGHPMSETAILYLDVVRNINMESNALLAAQLWDQNIDNRKGSRGLTLVTLALNAETDGDFSDYLRRVALDYPELFESPPRMPNEYDQVRVARIAHALRMSGRTDEAEELAQLGLSSALERGFDGSWVSGTLLTAFYLRDEDVIDRCIEVLRANLSWFELWDASDHIHPWVADYSNYPNYVALKEEWTAAAVERRDRVNTELGTIWKNIVEGSN